MKNHRKEENVLPIPYVRWIGKVIRTVDQEVPDNYGKLFLVILFLIVTLPLTILMATLTAIAKFIIAAEDKRKENGGKLPFEYIACGATLMFASFAFVFLMIDRAKGGALCDHIQNTIEHWEGVTISPFSENKIVTPRAVKADEIVRIVRR